MREALACPKGLSRDKPQAIGSLPAPEQDRYALTERRDRRRKPQDMASMRDAVNERRKLLFHRWLRIQARRAPAARVAAVMARACSIQRDRVGQGDEGDFVQVWIDALANPSSALVGDETGSITWLLGSRDPEAARLRRSSPLPVADPAFGEPAFRAKLAKAARRGTCPEGHLMPEANTDP